jgi:ubiquinone/menaquinone biosynthesis C-methylase UbiE
MDLKELQKNWDQFGRTDPLWAIRTAAGKEGNKWRLDEFFATGQAEIQSTLEHIASLGIRVPRNAALDFGCGIGRLTQALAGHFEQTYGIDIAPSMIEQARRYNQHGDRCEYVLNETDHLGVFDDGSFDFICSLITLQHMEPVYAKRYIGEFLRLLRPGGVLVFQLPSKRIGHRHRARLKAAFPGIVRIYHRWKRGEAPIMEMYATSRSDMVSFLESKHAPVLGIREILPSDDWLTLQYLVGAPASDRQTPLQNPNGR